MKKNLLALAIAAAAPLAHADSTLVDFERVWTYGADVNGYYAGGLSSDGASGTNLGISFVNVSGLSNDALGPYYSNAPSPLGVAYAHDTAYMNIAGGVTGALGLFYASPTAITGAIRAFSGLNGTGSLLGTFDFAGNDGGSYTTWTAATFSFAGIARSFDFSATADVAAFDNLAVTAVPEPSTVALMLAGGVGLLRVVRRRRA